MSNDYPNFKGVGPTMEPRCPHCLNSFQNGTPHGSPNLRCCATCKTIFSADPIEVAQAIEAVRYKGENYV